MAEEYALNALQAWAAGEASTRCVSQEEMAGVILQALLAPLLQAIQVLRRDTESSFIASSLCELAFQTLLRSSTAHHFFGVAVEPSRPRFSTPVSFLCSYHCRSVVIQPPFSFNNHTPSSQKAITNTQSKRQPHLSINKHTTQ